MLDQRKLVVMNIGEARMLAPDASQKWAIVSIVNPKDEPVEFKQDNIEALHLRFDDTDRLCSDMVAFNMAQAAQVWDFVDKVWDHVDTFAVHCLMGLSRSPGIAAAIAKVKYDDDRIWFERKTPNRRVYRAMLETARSRGLIGTFERHP